jgi:hypothetical protein
MKKHFIVDSQIMGEQRNNFKTEDYKRKIDEASVYNVSAL